MEQPDGGAAIDQKYPVQEYQELTDQDGRKRDIYGVGLNAKMPAVTSRSG
jgi:hypothetical protein